MRKKPWIITVLVIVVLGALVSIRAGEQEPTELPEDPKDFTFSNTQTWDRGLLRTSEKSTHYDLPWEGIVLPPPPTNLSEETKKELEQLVLDKNLRTEEAIFAINAEIEEDTFQFGEHTLTEYLEGDTLPKTAQLLSDSFNDLGISIMKFKREFDRVRPHFLETSIEPVIEVPNHPAYPSGHSTQAHFLAYVLSELDSDNRDMYFSRAGEIARNREIAGVHYGSDSEAGKSLAEQSFNLLMTSEEFTALLDEAKTEWQ